jgi:hypothetical protein
MGHTVLFNLFQRKTAWETLLVFLLKCSENIVIDIEVFL